MNTLELQQAVIEYAHQSVSIKLVLQQPPRSVN